MIVTASSSLPNGSNRTGAERFAPRIAGRAAQRETTLANAAKVAPQAQVVRLKRPDGRMAQSIVDAQLCGGALPDAAALNSRRMRQALAALDGMDKRPSRVEIRVTGNVPAGWRNTWSIAV